MRYSRHFVVVFAAKEYVCFLLKLSYSEMLKNHYKQVVPPTRPITSVIAPIAIAREIGSIYQVYCARALYPGLGCGLVFLYEA
jgi:hypothetical protein